MHRIQRKPSSETLASVGMDSTLDSRISSTEIPQMELLKVNYVHQCKEAFMTKTGSPSPNYSYMEYKRNLPPQSSSQVNQRKNISRIAVVNRHEAPNKPLPPPPPPPTVESWQFLQTPKRTTNTPPKTIKLPRPPLERYTAAAANDNSSYCQSSSCGGDTGCDSDNTLSGGDAIKSNSWNYRDRLSTCDVRRDIARAGIKSRADRIARIERTECEHGTGKERKEKTSENHVAVAKINKMFEQQKHKLVLPPQPKRPAPVPYKEPNLRLKPTLKSSTPSSVDNNKERFKQSLSVTSECSECLSECQANSSCSEASGPQENDRYRRMECRPQSRIPKLVNEARSPPMQCLDLNKRIEERFPKSKSRECLDKPEADKSALGIDPHMLKHTRASKVERIHIRKKRQPLLIINQLNDHSKEGEEEEEEEDDDDNAVDKHKLALGQTCGYKNCNFSKCPMSKSQHDLSRKDLPEDLNTNKLKRLSLESNSDSGVSSSNDSKDEKKQSVNFLKNLERCSDGKNNTTKALKKSEHFENEYAYDKYKISAQDGGKGVTNFAPTTKSANKTIGVSHIKIQVGKSVTSFSGNYNTADPNDVSNFSKKSLTKTTPTEALNNSIAKSAAKQCNLENEQRLKMQNNLQIPSVTTTNIKIDDDWVKEDGVENDNDFNDTDSLIVAERSHKKPINSNDNAVKIFVRSSSVNNNDLTRSSCMSANSFASQTSVATNSSSSNSTCSSSTCSSSTTSSASSVSSSSGCSGSLNADNHSLCDLERECCCQYSKAGGLFFNHPSDREGERAGAQSPLSSTDAISDISCVTCSTVESTVVDCSTATTIVPLRRQSNSIPPCCSAADNGIFWNNAYMPLDGAQEDDNNGGDLPCCCSLSSCDDDNCSYYEGECGNDGCALGEAVNNNNIEITHSYQAKAKQTFQPIQLRSKQQHPQAHQQEHYLPPKLPKRNVRMSSGEELLLRQQMLRKTDVIHELRPRSLDGVVDSGVSLNGDNGCGSDVGESQQDCEARRLKRGHVLSELLETERIYVNEMSSILKGYCDQMHSEEMIHLVPASLQGKEDILFGNLHELYTFHNDIFLKDLENCISTTELVALCFVQRRDTFYRLYSFYCQNIPRSDRLRETLVDTHLFLQECQKRLGHKLPLAAYLLKPVQRITKYQLLLKDLLRFSDSGSCTKELQKALDCMLIVLKCVNDSMHQVAITGFPTDLSQQGELLLQDSFQVWSESKKDIRLRIKPQQRHIFLYQKSMLFCKQTSKPGHNKSTYQFKHYLKMSQIGLTESVRGDTKRFEVWLQGRQEVHTLQAPTLDIKNKWVAEIKKVLLNQLEELKGEKIKQYGLNHRGLRQTTSWDTPNILLGSARTISCDASSESSNRNSNCSSSDDNCTTASIGSVMPLSSNVSVISGSTLHGGVGVVLAADKEQSEACGWSSDYSNSEDEMSTAEDNNSTPGSKYVALADYVAVGHSEVSMREGDTVELLKVGCAGWWYIRIIDTSSEGWAPAAYLESINRKSSRSSSRNQDRLNLPKLIE